MLLALASCGFEPLHGQARQQSTSADLSAISVTAQGRTIQTSTTTSSLTHRFDALLAGEIEHQINPEAKAADKRYRLTISFTELDVPQFVKPDGTASRGDLIYDSNYSILRLADGVQVSAGSIRRVSSYNTSPNADYASYVSIEDARQRGILELAQDYKLRLATLSSSLSNTAPKFETKPSEAVPELQPLRGYEALRP